MLRHDRPPAGAAVPIPLAPAATKAPAAQAPREAAPVPLPKATPLAAPPKASPLAPPATSGMAPPPWARPAARRAGRIVANGPKILGAVAIIFGAVATATFWLPMLGGPIGWTGIAVGALGVIVGIVAWWSQP